MNDLLVYFVKVALCQAAFYLFYLALLSRGTHFTLNRFYLLGAMAVPFIIPLIHFTPEPVVTGRFLPEVLQTVQIGPGRVEATAEGLATYTFLSMAYLAGLGLFGVGFLRQCIKIFAIRSKCVISTSNGIRTGISKKDIVPFSFFSTLYLNEKTLRDENLEQIVLHEKVHIEQKHSLDVLFTETLCRLTWFNPLSWKIKSALKETHEYLADSGVSEQTPDAAGYFLLLYHQLVGVQPGFASHFNQSLTLKRIKMMKKNRSGRYHALKLLPLLPLALLLVMIFSGRNSADALISMNPSDQPVVENSLASNVLQSPYEEVDQMPQFPGGQDALVKFMSTNVKYPEAARKAGKEGTVQIGFTVTKTGKISNIKVKKSVETTLDAEAVRVVSVMPDWIPGKAKGQAVDIEMVLPVSFKLEKDGKK